MINGISEFGMERIGPALTRETIRGAVGLTNELASQALIIKLMPGLTHEIVGQSFLEMVTDEIKSLPGYHAEMYDLVGTARFLGLSDRGEAISICLRYAGVA